MQGMSESAKPTKENPLRTSVGDFWVDDDEIIHTIVIPMEEHGIEQAKLYVSYHNRLSYGSPRLLFSDIRQVNIGASRAARKWYTSPEATALKRGMAILVDSPLATMAGNMFMALSRPPYPTRLFRDKKMAMDWLHSLDEHSQD